MTQPRRTRVERNIYRRPTGVLEIGYRDGAGKQRWRTVEGGILAARRLRDDLLARRGRGERMAPNTRLRFGDAADRYLAGPVSDLRETTQTAYAYALSYLRPRFQTQRLDSIEPDDVAALVRDLRAEGKSETTIAGALGVLGRVYKYAERRLGWSGTNPASVLLTSERPKSSQAQRRVIFDAEQDTQTLQAMDEPYRTLFTTLALTGARISEVLALVWSEAHLSDPDDAAIAFRFQVPRRGRCPDCGSTGKRARSGGPPRCLDCGSSATATRERLPLKTDGSERTVPIPRGLALVLSAHKLAGDDLPADGAYVFATATGRPLSQRNANRALRAAQKRATAPDGSPTFPALQSGGAVPRGELPSPHSFRHTLASRALLAGESVDEVAFLLGHRSANVTRAVYIQEVSDARRRAMRRSRIAAEYGSVLEAAAATGLPAATASTPD